MQVSLNAILLKIQGRFLILALVTAELHTLAGSCYFLGPLNQPNSPDSLGHGIHSPWAACKPFPAIFEKKRLAPPFACAAPLRSVNCKKASSPRLAVSGLENTLLPCLEFHSKPARIPIPRRPANPNQPIPPLRSIPGLSP